MTCHQTTRSLPFRLEEIRVSSLTNLLPRFFPAGIVASSATPKPHLESFPMKRSFLLACSVGLMLTGTAVRAEISRIDNFLVLGYFQPDGTTLDLQGSFFTSSLISTDDNEFSSVTMEYPGPNSPQVLFQDTTTIYRHFSPFYSNPNDLDAEYPFGTYNYNTTGLSGPSIATVEYSGKYFPSSIPALVAGSYNAAQGLDSTADFFFDFVPYVANADAEESLIFFSIVDTTDNIVAFESNFLPSSTDGVTVPAGTLTPTHSFRYRLVYSDRITGEGTGAIFSPLLAFDYYTEGTFNTAIPEASSWVLTTLAILLLGAGRATQQRMTRSME